MAYYLCPFLLFSLPFLAFLIPISSACFQRYYLWCQLPIAIRRLPVIHQLREMGLLVNIVET